jgi:hypothetical protein
MRKLLAPAGKPWPEVLPRAYRVTLQGKRRWPARVETWGPVIEGGPDQLLAEIEFRDPVFGQSLPAEKCGRLFRFDPGESEVEDETAKVNAELTGG